MPESIRVMINTALQAERDGYAEFPVKDGNRLVKVDIRKLLNGIESETQRKDSQGYFTNIYVGGDVEGNIIAGDEYKVKNKTTPTRKRQK